jgi:glycerol-3-phosphate acyltransferase PlsX
LNIGEEEMKGLDSIKQAAKMLQSCEAINYIGYIEGNDIYKAKADVVVCDGFIGNVALKASEGMAHFISTVIKSSFKNGFFSKIAMLLASPVLLTVKKKLDLDQYNGATLLGLRGIVIKSHGGATPKAFLTAIEVAMHEVEKDVPNRIQSEVEKLMQQ